jgi:hypothetical protein
MMSKISQIIASVLLLLSEPALAQPDVRRGLSLTREHCAQCHAIGDASESPVAAAPARYVRCDCKWAGVEVGGLPGRKRQSAQAVIDLFETTAAAKRAGKDALKELLNKLFT